MKTLIYLNTFLLATNFSGSYAQNTWIQKLDFSGTGRYGAVGFSIGAKGYVGTGQTESGTESDFWEYDPMSNIWTQMADVAGGIREFAIGFSIGDKGYVGTGNGSFGEQKDWWEYDPATNVWTQKASLPGEGREKAVGFSIGEKGYVGTGEKGSGFKKDFYEYDPATDTWTEIADYPVQTARAVGFCIGNKGYVCTGAVTKKLRQYDPGTDTWTNKADFPSLGRSNSIGFSIGGKGYFGTGYDLFDKLNNDFWEYDTVTDSWTQLADFAGGERWQAVGFAIGNKGYVGTGDDTSYKKDFWEYTPDCDVPAGLTTTNITSTTAQLNWNAVATATKYNIRYKRDSVGAAWISKSATATSKTITGLLPNSKYRWKVKSVCGDLKSEFSSTVKFTTLPLRISNAASNQAALGVYPNPVRSTATVSFIIEEHARTYISLLDLAGRGLKILVESDLEAGTYEVPLNREQLKAGLYFLEMKSGDETLVTKIVIE